MNLIALTTAQGGRVHLNPTRILALWGPLKDYHSGQVVLAPGAEDEALTVDLRPGDYPKLLAALEDLGGVTYNLDDPPSVSTGPRAAYEEIWDDPD